MIFLYQDKCFLLSGWMHTGFTLCMLGTFSCIFVVCVFQPPFLKNPPLRNTLRLSNSLDPYQFNKMSGLIWTNHAFCKDNKRKAIAVLTH